MEDEPNYQELLFKAIKQASALVKELGHPPLFGERRLDDALKPLLPPMTTHGTEPGRTWVSYGSGGPDLLNLVHDLGDPVARAVIADLLFRPAEAELQEALTPTYYDESEDEEEEDVDPAEYFGVLHEYLARVPPHDVQSEAALLWELHAAGVTGYLPRLVSVCDQLLARHPSSVNRTTAIQAVFQALTETLSLWPAGWIGAWNNSPSRDLNRGYLGAAAINGVAKSLDAALGLEPVGKSQHSQDRLTAMLKLDAWTNELKLATPLDAVLRLLAAWCSYQLGVELGESHRCLAAAKEFQAGLGEQLPGESALLGGFSPWATAAAYLGAGRSDLAEEILFQICESNGVAQNFLSLARCRHLQGKESETLDAFEQYVKRRGDADPREQFQATLAIQYGLSAKILRDRMVLLGALAMSAEIKGQGEQLVSWFDPFYDRLSESARNKWWKALYGLSSSDYRRHVGEEVWNDVAAAFGETVNVELRFWIFQQFLPTVSDLLTAAPSPGYRPDAEKAVLLGKGTLGQHIETLLQSRVPVRPLAQRLDGWLEANHVPLREYLKKPRVEQRLRELSRLRGLGTHAHATRDEAARIFDLAREVLRVLVQSESPHSG